MRTLLQRTHNPDILTCIANLSNDEVFTPPAMASAMLDLVAEAWAKDHDGQNLWENPNAKFLDPFAKTGIFLREITRRLSQGLAKQIPDVQERVNHILTKQVYGIGITELTALMARRSLYCSKYANSKHSICTEFPTPEGNIWFQRTEHTWVGGTKESRIDAITGEEGFVYTHRRCSYCGAGEADYGRGDDLETHAYAFIHTDNIKERIEEIFGADMHFDVICGNPPYQLSDGGGTGSSAIPLYHKFVEQAQKLEPSLITMIIPSRWFTGGKGLDQFRNRMLSDQRLRTIVDYPDSRNVFEGVDIAGGICYFLWNRDDPGLCRVVTISSGQKYELERDLQEHTVFIRDNRAVRIVAKVLENQQTSFSSLVSARRPFGIDSSDSGTPGGDLYLFKAGGDSRYSRKNLTKGHDLVDTWRVLVSKSSSEHAGQTDKNGRKRVLSRIEVMPPGSVATETYLIIGPFRDRDEAMNVAAYMRTRFFRFLVSSILLTQNISRASFDMVPYVDFSERWDDDKLSKKFALSNDEIALIESVVRPMEDD